MRISTRGEYGLRALLYLGERYGGEAVPSAEIAERESIPEAYLNQLLMALRNAGLVKSARGAYGGYALARQPASICLDEAVLALEGSLSPLENPDQSSSADLLEAEIIGDVWSELAEMVTAKLASISLQDLVQQKMARQNILMYHI